jgi:hypothetical protein
MPAICKEDAFAELVREYENLWVAIAETDGVEYIVGHGSSAVQAANEAREKGHADAMLFKVPSFKSRFILLSAVAARSRVYFGTRRLL